MEEAIVNRNLERNLVRKPDAALFQRGLQDEALILNMHTDFNARPETAALSARPLPGRLRRALHQMANQIGSPVTGVDHASGVLILSEAGLILGAQSAFDDRAFAQMESVAFRTHCDAMLLTEAGAHPHYAFFRVIDGYWRSPYARWRECPGLVFSPSNRERGNLVHIGPRGLLVTPLASNDDTHGHPLKPEVAA